MKGPQGFGELMNIIMNVIMGLAISIVVLYRVQAFVGPQVPVFTAGGLLSSWVASFCVGYTLGELIPIADWAVALSMKLKAKGFANYLVSSIVLGACFAIGITIVLGFINNIAQGVAAWGGFIAMHLLVNIGCAVIVVLLTYWLAVKIAVAISGFDPTKATQHE